MKRLRDGELGGIILRPGIVIITGRCILTRSSSSSLSSSSFLSSSWSSPSSWSSTPKRTRDTRSYELLIKEEFLPSVRMNSINAPWSKLIVPRIAKLIFSFFLSLSRFLLFLLFRSFFFFFLNFRIFSSTPANYSFHFLTSSSPTPTPKLSHPSFSFNRTGVGKGGGEGETELDDLSDVKIYFHLTLKRHVATKGLFPPANTLPSHPIQPGIVKATSTSRPSTTTSSQP